MGSMKLEGIVPFWEERGVDQLRMSESWNPKKDERLTLRGRWSILEILSSN